MNTNLNLIMERTSKEAQNYVRGKCKLSLSSLHLFLCDQFKVKLYSFNNDRHLTRLGKILTNFVSLTSKPCTND